MGYSRMITKLMEDTCLKDMQATKLSLRKIVKNLQVHPLSKVLRSIPWTSLSSGTPSSTLLLSSSSKIFMKLFSTGASALTSILRPSSSRPKSVTSVLSADTMIFRTTPIPALDVNNNTPAARIAWLAGFPRFQAASVKLQAPKLLVASFKRQATSVKLQAASYKLQDTRAFIKFWHRVSSVED